MSTPIAIDVWSDIACPWCYIGKRHLEQGIALLGDQAPQVRITYHSYELSPDTPEEVGVSHAEYLAQLKGIPTEQAQAMIGTVTAAAANAGLDYHYERLQTTNTFRAHELLHFAKEHGTQLELAERLLRAYFTEGRHVGHLDELVELAAEAGLDAAAAREALVSGRYAGAVRDDIAQAGAYGITGVPFFVINGKYGLSGAQPAQVFAQALQQLAGEQTAAADGGTR